MTSEVDLGLLDECEEWFLTSKFFPSKVGGKPAWLNLAELPSPQSLLCNVCQQPCVLLCQVYAPLDEKEDCFHRTIFVFLCLNGSCCKANSIGNLKVYRCQLPRQNEFYSPDPPEDKDEQVVYSTMPALCVVCGCVGRAQCGSCQSVRYCSRVHQTADWKGGHKMACKEYSLREKAGLPLQPVTVSFVSKMFLFKEWLLEIEPEPLTNTLSETENQAMERRMAEYKMLQQNNAIGTMSNIPETELNSFAEVGDKVFWKFSKQTALNPEQVLRFHRNGQPLWITGKNILQLEDVPPCQYCNGPRIFEFQVMPQLLNSLNIACTPTSIDWGILCIYTCKDSCNAGPAYKMEFIYKQDITEETNQ